MPLSDFTRDEVELICKDCCSLSELARCLNYSSRGSILYVIKNYLDKNEIDYSHFTGIGKNRVKRNYDNIFIENSTVSQKILRRYYFDGDYTPYKCSICGQEPFWNGKPLTLILDHINGYNNDDRLENLRWVCPNCDRQLPTTTGCNKNHGIRVEKYSTCIDCGKRILKENIRCKVCNMKYLSAKGIESQKKKGIHNFVNREVNREELKSLIREKTMLEVGESYGVSDNAIRRWCKKYELPYKKTEINKISDEDWRDI